MTPGNKKTIFRRLIAYPVLVFVFLFSMIFLAPEPVYAQPVDPNAAPAAGQSTTQDPETTCAVEKIGWIVCPITEGAATIGDKLFAFLANNFLQTEPELVSSDEGNGTITAWGIARNLANVMFIIAFLVIIYSQVTGAGISNYGLKRMLPRLIIAAIAVNISYYICQGMVDISNILGFEIKKALVDIASDVSSQHALASASGNGSNTQTADGSLGTIAKAILVVGGLVWIAIALFSPILGLVVITCIVIIIILLLRKAFIVLLVVASPIAFVAYLLPNTEKYFSKWLSMFWQLLMVFPIVALLFGGGQLASSIILAAGMKNTDMYKIEGEGCINLQQVSNNSNANSAQSSTSTTSPPGTECGTSAGPGWMLAMVAAGIAVAPLLAVWSVLKGALAAAGAIGGKIAGAVQKSTAGGVGMIGKPVGAGKKAAQRRIGENAQGAWQRAQARGLDENAGFVSRNVAGRHARRQARRAERLGISKSELERGKRAALADELGGGGDSNILNGMTEGAQRRARGSATAQLDKLQSDEVQASALQLRNLEDRDLQNIVNDPNRTVNDPEVAAAIQHLAERQDFRGLEQALNRFGGQEGVASRVLASSISKNAGELFTGGDIGQISRGAFQGTYRDTVRSNISNGAITAEKAASLGPSMSNEVSDIAAGDRGAMQALVNSSHAALNDPILNKKIGRNRTQLQNFAAGRNAQSGVPVAPGTAPGAGHSAW